MPVLTTIGICGLAFLVGYLSGLFQAQKMLKKEIGKAAEEALKAIEEAKKVSMQ